MVIIILYGPLWCVNHIRVAIQIYVKLSCVHTRRNMLSRSNRAIYIAMYVLHVHVYVDHIIRVFNILPGTIFALQHSL